MRFAAIAALIRFRTAVPRRGDRALRGPDLRSRNARHRHRARPARRRRGRLAQGLHRPGRRAARRAPRPRVRVRRPAQRQRAVGIGLLYRFAPLRRVDHLLGIPLGAIAASVTVYLSLVAVVTVDGWLKPLHDKGALAAPDVAALQAMIQANPAAAALVDPKTLTLMAQAAAKAPITAEQLAKLNAALSFYETNIRPAIVESRIGPLFLALGADLPIIGHHVDYPTP